MRPAVLSLGLVALLVTAAATPADIAAAPRVAVLDVEQAFQRSPLAMAAAMSLKQALGARRGALKRASRELASLRQQLSYGTGSGAERRDLQQRIAARTAELERMRADFEQTLADARQQRLETALAEVARVGEDIAAQRGLRLVLVNAGADAANGAAPRVASAAEVDITNAVIEALLSRPRAARD